MSAGALGSVLRQVKCGDVERPQAGDEQPIAGSGHRRGDEVVLRLEHPQNLGGRGTGHAVGVAGALAIAAIRGPRLDANARTRTAAQRHRDTRRTVFQTVLQLPASRMDIVFSMVAW